MTYIDECFKRNVYSALVGNALLHMSFKLGWLTVLLVFSKFI